MKMAVELEKIMHLHNLATLRKIALNVLRSDFNKKSLLEEKIYLFKQNHNTCYNFSMLSKLKIFYDGSCHLCSFEMSHHKRKKESNNFEFIDITSFEFKASQYNLDQNLIQQKMHAQDEEGNLFVGIEAFIEIWKRLAGYELIVKFAENKIINFLMRIGYSIFAKLRVYLPKKKVCNI